MLVRRSWRKERKHLQKFYLCLQVLKDNLICLSKIHLQNQGKTFLKRNNYIDIYFFVTVSNDIGLKLLMNKYKTVEEKSHKYCIEDIRSPKVYNKRNEKGTQNPND